MCGNLASRPLRPAQPVSALARRSGRMDPMQGRGWVAMAPGRLYYRGQIDPGSLHAHHAVQLLVGDGLVLRGSDGIEHACSAALIPANAPHAIVEGTLEGLVVLM